MIFEYFQANKLFFRGARVWRAVIDDLMAKGMKNAQNVLHDIQIFNIFLSFNQNKYTYLIIIESIIYFI